MKKKGPFDPTNEKLYDFLRTLFSEIGKLFSDEYIHLGADEVSMDCWKSNPKIIQFMKNQSIEGKFNLLEQRYITRLLDLTNDLKLKKIVWQDVFDNNVTLQEDTIVQVWWPDDWKDELSNVTAKGHFTLLSACWYLDHIAPYSGDWLKYYRCDPLDFPGTNEQKEKLLGGEACMWTEYVDK